MKKIILKQKSYAFGKNIYLIGQDEQGINYWLEAPQWDCGWYWGFGYIETYTKNNDPSNSRDISSHQHWSGFVGEQKGGKYIQNIYDNNNFVALTFDSKTGWILSELFQQFYTLQEFAECTHRNPFGCHLTTVDAGLGDMREWSEKINKELIPKVTAKILELLTPEK